MRPSLTLRRSLAGTVAVVLALAVTGVIAYRVLAPAETLSPAVRPYPERATEMARTGAIRNAPLIVDGRLRVYAEKMRVWADAPVNRHTQTSPFWAYRRWPAQVVGVTTAAVTAGAADAAPVVVTRWSDGALVALDARTGRVAWRAAGPEPVTTGFQGRRTGASAVYEPPGLFTSRTRDGRPVVLVAGVRQVRAYDAATGAPLWGAGQDLCHGVAFTGETTYVTLDGCRGNALTLRDAGTGRALGSWQLPGTGSAEITPWGCAIGRSGCALFQVRRGVGGSQWRLDPAGTVRPEPYARSAKDLVVGDGLVQYRPDEYVALVDRATGAQRWTVRLNGTVVGADARGVYVLTPWYAVLVLDLATGRPNRMVNLRRQGDQGRSWTVGHVYVRDGFLAIERLSGQGGRDDRYYFHAMPMLLALG